MSGIGRLVDWSTGSGKTYADLGIFRDPGPREHPVIAE
jgi:hypothetical protein